ncbi:hypothetical protein [uncultured Microbacterium sp.]|uniref:hypothetical protein n=1 Tax=uncultured Microbacterium sp. TaxID=191216 RepID=UPI002628D6EA|nr:hypothetical protein [uncultured Microbacterium sp.]
MPGFAKEKNAVGLDPEQDINGLLHMILELASEVSVLSDRLSVLTALLGESGSVDDEQIDRFVPQGELAEKLNTDKRRLTQRLVAASTRDYDDLSQLI